MEWTVLRPQISLCQNTARISAGHAGRRKEDVYSLQPPHLHGYAEERLLSPATTKKIHLNVTLVGRRKTVHPIVNLILFPGYLHPCFVSCALCCAARVHLCTQLLRLPQTQQPPPHPPLRHPRSQHPVVAAKKIMWRVQPHSGHDRTASSMPIRAKATQCLRDTFVKRALRCVEYARLHLRQQQIRHGL